jgi:Neutral/alkaline non-lysosomal ceramidase.
MAMRVGASKIDITPELPFALSGSYHLRMAESIKDPLYANCVVIESKGVTIAFAACDLLGLEYVSIKDICNKVKSEIDIRPENIIISCTHNHQGPDVLYTLRGLPFGSFVDIDMVNSITSKIAEGIIHASKSMKPARIGYGKGNVENCGFNRRYIMADGKVRCNPFPLGLNPDRLMVEGPVDKEVQVTWFEDLEGNYISVIVHFSSHPAVLYNEAVVSSDFPGSMREVILTILGEAIPIVYLQGACGNIDTCDFENARTAGMGYEGLKRIGRILGGEVIKILSQNYYIEQEEYDIFIKTSFLDIPYRRVITQEEYEEALNVLNDIPEIEKVSTPDYNIMYSLYKNISIIRLYEAMKQSGTVQVEIKYIKLGELIFICNPSEFFVEYQLEIKRRFKDNPVMVLELTNGYCGYVPTPQAFALGGYETEFKLGSRLDTKAGRMITDECIRLIETGFYKTGAE